MTLPPILENVTQERPENEGAHIVDVSLKNYFDSFPSESQARELLSQAFVINQPMIRVGGDGYWLHAAEDDMVTLVVFDCMGHGRLASIMTRVYIKSIERAVLTKRLTDPAEIVHNIHDNIQEEFSTKPDLIIGSGADIAVIRYSIHERKIWYSGAKMNLVYIVNGTQEIIKAHRRQVGDHFDISRTYETHPLQFDSDTAVGIYLFSDGLTDLIGGTKNKKLGKKQTFQLLLESQHKPIQKARKYVVNFIEKWSEGEERIDDLLLVHFRI